ncbi:uncharacterized protein DFL_006371 [Arthrobotrys flagrans]|uniref:Uncharacterized protein n=1 Tax=Arthrobotrys flagrans TaxID=97331 RepID=A0A437A0S6_ARTFL|nr:hypothetical protein DFL_006371 [Arthrobotrys flagrans]
MSNPVSFLQTLNRRLKESERISGITSVGSPAPPQTQFKQRSILSEIYEKLLDVANVGYVGLHQDLLHGALEGVAIPLNAVLEFEKILQRLVENLRVKEKTSYESQQYWAMITVFTYIPETEAIQATIRTLAFTISRDAYKFIDRKSSLESVKIKTTSERAQYDFNDRIWAAIKGVLSEEMLKKGEQDLRALLLQPLDIPV